MEKKKFKSGSWKGKKGVEVDFDESPEMKKYLKEHSNSSGPIICYTGGMKSDLFDNINVDESGAAG